MTFIWRYHTSHADKSHLRLLMFGLWTNGGISTPLVSLSKNGSLVCYSDRITWLGNKTAAVFQLRGVTIQDGGEYGLMLNFEAFTLRDSVNLTVIGKYISDFFQRLFLYFLLICILNVEIASTQKSSEFQMGFEPTAHRLYHSKSIKPSTECTQLCVSPPYNLLALLTFQRWCLTTS